MPVKSVVSIFLIRIKLGISAEAALIEPDVSDQAT